MDIYQLQKNIPKGWVMKKMEDFVKEGAITLGRGEVISKEDIKNYPGENPIYSSSVKNNALFGTYAKYMFDEELITWSVDGGGDFFYRPKHKFSVTNVSGYMNADPRQFDYKFLAYYLQEEHSKKSFDYQNKAHPSVIQELYEVVKPPIKEQQKIAEILVTVDEDLVNIQKVIEKTEKLKFGLMQQLFTCGIRNTKFKKVKLGDISKISTGTTPSTNKKDYYIGDNPFIKTGEIINERIRETNIFISDQAVKDYRLKKYQPGTILVAMYGQGKTRGQTALLDIEACITQNAAAIEPIKDIDSVYLWFFLKSQYELLRGDGIQGHISHLNLFYMKNYEVPIPSLKEQLEIAEILSAVDEKISVNKKLKEKLTQLKKGLMSDLLSGKVRVK